MDTFTIVKAGVHVVSALGVSKVLGDIVRNNTTVVTPVDKVLVTAGSLVLGSMIGQQASKHVNEQIEQVVTWYANRGEEDTTT